MDHSLFRYVWSHTKKDQGWILMVVLLSMPTYFLFFDLPKQIVNGPIQGGGFETEGATASFLRIAFDVPSWISPAGRVEIFSGFELDRFGYLVAMSMVFLLLVCINGLFKFYINTFKGRLGERTLRRLRFDLVDRIMRFPASHVRRMRAPEAATMVKDEIEPLGAFIGDAFIQPVFVGGQAITVMVFIMVQSVWLGLIALVIVLFQAVIIPRLRHELLRLNKRRQLLARELAGRVGEVVDTVADIHVNDASNFERADISSRLARIFLIRYELYQRKFFIKFLNNFLAQITPFLFYLIGGYFAIRGEMDIGQLIAVIAAYKDLPAPIRELILWDQRRLDVQIKYSQVMDQFSPEEMLERDKQAVHTDAVAPLTGDIAVSNLGIVDDTGGELVSRLTFKLPLTQASAALGKANSGAESVCEVLAGLVTPTSGQCRIGDANLSDLPEYVTGRRIGYVGAEIYLRQASVRDNLLYSLRHAPLRPRDYDEKEARERERFVRDARSAGNSELDVRASWEDLEAAGVGDEHELGARIYEIFNLVDLADEMFVLGLRGRIDPDQHPGLVARLVEARKKLRQALEHPDLAQLVEPFDAGAYNDQATVAENLLFGTAIGDALSEAGLASNAYLQTVLAQAGLDARLFEMGRGIATTVVEIFADLSPDHPLFEQLSFMEADEIPVYDTVLKRNASTDFAAAGAEDRAMLQKLAFGYVEPQYRLSLLDAEMKTALLAARKAFRDGLPEDLGGAIAFYDAERYNAAATVQDNILLGRIAYGMANGAQRVNEEIGRIVDELDLRAAIFDVGLDFDVGIGGRRLTVVQRQKLGLARALVKRPDYVIVNRIFASLDEGQQAAILRRVLDFVKTMHDGRAAGVFWALAAPRLADLFDHAQVYEGGRLVEQGRPDALAKKSGAYSRLLEAG